MELKEVKAFVKSDESAKKEADVGYITTFIPSGFEGCWLKVRECYDYTVGAEYASQEETVELIKQGGR